MNNFKCSSCNTEFFVPNYTIAVKNSKTIYKYGNKVIECPDCKCCEISYLEKPGDFSTLKLGKYSMLNISQRHESLKKRSHDHFKREIEERKRLIDKCPVTQPDV